MSELFSTRLETWYKDNCRMLPWRGISDPYKIWISEVILQQTRVAQGYDYYLRFINRFPTVKDLAYADLDEVLRYWQGLGYYSRARNLHKAAQEVVELGEFPVDYKKVRALKGIGDYTAAAICSFAYQMPYAVVDGNVYRVLARYFGIETPIDTGVGKRYFADLAQELLDKKNPALYNQAIMDFGATQCTPKSPSCLSCPLANSCLALAKGKVDILPIKSHQTKVSNRFFYYIYLKINGKTCLHKRQPGDIWEGLYEPLLLESSEQWSMEQLLEQPMLKALLKMKEASICCKKERIKHQLSHRILHTSFFLLEINERPKAGVLPGDYVWIDEIELYRYAVPKLVSLLYECCV